MGPPARVLPIHLCERGVRSAIGPCAASTCVSIRATQCCSFRPVTWPRCHFPGRIFRSRMSRSSKHRHSGRPPRFDAPENCQTRTAHRPPRFRPKRCGQASRGRPSETNMICRRFRIAARSRAISASVSMRFRSASLPHPSTCGHALSSEKTSVFRPSSIGLLNQGDFPATTRGCGLMFKTR